MSFDLESSMKDVASISNVYKEKISNIAHDFLDNNEVCRYLIEEKNIPPTSLLYALATQQIMLSCNMYEGIFSFLEEHRSDVKDTAKGAMLKALEEAINEIKNM